MTRTPNIPDAIVRAAAPAIDITEIARKLTPNQREVVLNLQGERKGLEPMWFGGSNDSHHSHTAIALTKKTPPIVERKSRGSMDAWGKRDRWSRKGSYVYRLTDHGNAVAAALHEIVLNERTSRRHEHP